MIPKILFQTSIKKPEKYIINNFNKYITSEWKYIHFVDDEIITFFKENPLHEFPNIIDKFNSIPTGAHKADLFRYYFLYINGGVFVDSDAMIQTNIEEITRDYSFFSVKGITECSGIFQGLIGCCPENEIIYKALIDAYQIDLLSLKENYHLLCINLNSIINNNVYDFKYKLYYEKYISFYECGTYDENNKLLLIHYFRTKYVVNTFELTNNNIRLHIPAIPYTITRDEYSQCAFTGKVQRFSPMMRSRGFEVYHYGVETSESGANKDIELFTKEEWTNLRIQSFMFLNPSLTLEEATKKNEDHTLILNELSNWDTPLCVEFNKRLCQKLKENYRSSRTDIICIPLARTYEAAIKDINAIKVETGIGYSGSYSDFRIFESYSWLSKTLCEEKKEPHNYWFVIPMSYNINEFRLSLNPAPLKVGFLLLDIENITLNLEN